MKATEKAQARELRQQGESIKEIAKNLRVSVGSVSVWVSDLGLTEDQIERLEKKQMKSREYILGRARKLKQAAAINHEKWKADGFERAGSDERFRLICALYWGEGRKSERTRYFSISNSDVRLLTVVLCWLLDSGYGTRVGFRVQYYPDNGFSEEEIKHWWLMNLLGLEESHLRRFTRNQINRASQRKNVGKLPFGTATINVCSTELYYNFMGGIDRLAVKGT